MLLRGSRRSIRRDAARGLKPLFDQLQCPWLCPALHNDLLSKHKARTTTTSTDRRASSLPTTPLSRTKTSLIRTPQERGLASATSSDYFQTDHHQPWSVSLSDYPQQWKGSNWGADNIFAELPPIDPSAPLIISDSTRMAPRAFTSRGGIGGDVEDIHRILHACLQLGQIDRASATVRRLGDIYKLDSIELLDAHNAFLGGMIAKLIISKDQSLLAQIQRWFEVEMRYKGIVPNETTIALMIQASFYDANEARIGRSVRRYLALAMEYDIYDETRAATLSRLTYEEAIRLTRVSFFL
jgi:DNA-directed RNA polymerase, mitochondrial